ncbi:MAG: hypothetical protein K6U80_12690 [Firmicutes bacterium]|nr:hypothetical protein [Bacillota bacterium]
MNSRLNMVGYNRTVKLEWLDFTAEQLLAGKPEAEIYNALNDSLQDRISPGSDAKRSSREKTITLLLKTWVRVPGHLKEFRDSGLEFLKKRSCELRVPVHWGATIAAYPFWKIVAETAGRLLLLQGQFTMAQVQRRLRETLGERETVSRSTRYVLRSFVNWGVLIENGTVGVYFPGAKHRIDDPNLIIWLIEAMLYATENGMKPLDSLLNSPALFPFDLKIISPGIFSTSAKIEVSRGNMDDYYVRLQAN